MKRRSVITIEVDDQGRFFLPFEVSKRYGFTAGANVRLEEDATSLHFSRSSNSLARLYVDPTNLCNFDCSICMLKVWDEPPGKIDGVTFSSILQGVQSFQPVPTVFFGGFGEPLTHPDILEMITSARSSGAEVEIVTNGILLSEAVAQKMVEVGMDRVWVSMDGATPESYADVRLGNELPQVISNLAGY